MTAEQLRQFLQVNDLKIKIENGLIIAPEGAMIGVAVTGGDMTSVVLFEEGYSRGELQVTAWWPTSRPAYAIIGGDGDIEEIGPTLSPDEVFCDYCNAVVCIRPVPVVHGYALCRACFGKLSKKHSLDDFPGRVQPYIPAALVWQDSCLAYLLQRWGIRSAEQIYALRDPTSAPEKVRRSLGSLLVDGRLTEKGQKVLEMVETVLRLGRQLGEIK